MAVSEIAKLKVADIDSARMLIRVEQGKGRKDRYVMLAPDLLDLLRQWWRVSWPGFFLPVRVLSRLFRRLFLRRSSARRRHRGPRRAR